ncbi:MAG: molybdenum cofactor guanylyltransferase [Marinilabiliales bacterium]|nr:molybdenum cofactor guanylyltransferase [Marinilabiliales bacterium]
MESRNITGILLSGGKSSRMGMEKGWVSFEGKPMIQYGIDLLRQFTDHILISTSDPSYAVLGYPTLADEYPACGPLAGLTTLLRHSSTDLNLVLPCDTPLLEPELFRLLLSQTGHWLAVVPVHDGLMEPLTALYRKAIVPHLEAALAAGERSPQRILAQLPVCYVDVKPMTTHHPLLFSNFNTPEELRLGSLAIKGKLKS